MKFSLEQPEELSRRAHCDDELKKNNGTMNSPRPSKENLDKPVPGINSDHVPAAISDRAGVRLEEDQADARLGQQDQCIDPPEAREVSMPPDRLVTQVRSDTLNRMYVTSQDVPRFGSHHLASHSDTCRDRMRAELEKSEEGREFLAREQARVDARKQEQSSSSSHKRAVSQEWDGPPEKFWRMGKEDVTMRQDITATSGASSSSASRGPAMDTPGNEPQMYKQKIQESYQGGKFVLRFTIISITTIWNGLSGNFGGHNLFCISTIIFGVLVDETIDESPHATLLAPFSQVGSEWNVSNIVQPYHEVLHTSRVVLMEIGGSATSIIIQEIVKSRRSWCSANKQNEAKRAAYSAMSYKPRVAWFSLLGLYRDGANNTKTVWQASCEQTQAARRNER